jgi:hypothetical protein
MSEDPAEPRNNSTDEDDTAKETELPACVKGDGKIPKVDCKPPKSMAKTMCPKNKKPKVQPGEEVTCTIWPLCATMPGVGIPGETCY